MKDCRGVGTPSKRQGEVWTTLPPLSLTGQTRHRQGVSKKAEMRPIQGGGTKDMFNGLVIKACRSLVKDG
jgi:hypothetical protein